MPVLEFCQRQRVIAADAGWRVLANGDEGFRQPLVLMLARDLPQPVIQLLAAAVESPPVMIPS